MATPLLVSGASAQKGVFPRLEINELQYKYEQFTLFILAWERIRDPKFRPEAGQFQHIGGIHGMPYTPWIGDPDEAMQAVRGAWLGYCNHASIMFPNWHRPYIMLLEQVICDVAQGIAGEYASKAGNDRQATAWMNAAKELRFPYWDWTLPETGTDGFPKILKDKEVTILKPTGEKRTHPNILSHYEFNNPVDGFNNRMEVPEWQNLPDPNNPPEKMAYFREWNRTWRRPNSAPFNITEDYSALDADLVNKSKTTDNKWQKGSWAQLTNDVSNMFGFPIDVPPELRANVWDEFSNTTFQSGRPDSKKATYFHSPYVWHGTPIEQPHNRVHLIIGGLGHMGDNDTAGFDPVFFLHHCNVDRLLSFWEHIYPDYVAGTEGYLDVDGETRVPFTQSGGTYIETSVEPVDSESPLMPFRKTDYTYWNSKDTHSLQLFNPNNDSRAVRNKYYTYKAIGPVSLEIDGRELPIDERNKQRGYLQRHFGYNPVKHSAAVTLPTFHSLRPGWKSVPEGLGLPEGATNISGYRQFIVETSLSPKYYSSSYTLNVTLEINGEHVDIGSVSVLGRGQSANCGNCQARRAANTRVRGVIQIPHDVVVGFFESSTLPESGPVSEAEIAATGSVEAHSLVQNLRVGLGFYVDLPSGKRHSELSKDSQAPANQEVRDEAIPDIRLLSCDVHQTDVGNEDEAPFGFHNWQDHGPPLGVWKKMD